MGNEAIARGAIEAGVEVVASYPGTPSSEIVETLLDISTELGFYAEWSVNEKVSFELVAGAALTGVRSLATLKGAGLNVVMDMFMTLPYTGTRGGLVLVVADDPGAHYSSNEQDSRFAAQWAMIPCLEPESHQEAKEMTAYAFGLSERLELPVVVRTASRLSHSSGVVELDRVGKSDLEPGFNKHWKTPLNSSPNLPRHTKTWADCSSSGTSPKRQPNVFRMPSGSMAARPSHMAAWPRRWLSWESRMRRRPLIKNFWTGRRSPEH